MYKDPLEKLLRPIFRQSQVGDDAPTSFLPGLGLMMVLFLQFPPQRQPTCKGEASKRTGQEVEEEGQVSSR